MKKEEKEEMPSSSGVSDGDEDEDEEITANPTQFLIPNNKNCSPNIQTRNASENLTKAKESPLEESVRLGTLEFNNTNPRSNSSVCGECRNLSCSNKETKNISSTPNTDIRNSYVFVTTDGNCDSAITVTSKHTSPNNESTNSSNTGVPLLRGSVKNSACENRRPPNCRYLDSSEDSDDERDKPTDEHYEGSEENDDDEYVRNRMFEKSRFNHYQKLLKEHEFIEGGDEEEYLRFLYHRHLYYNQLQKISPKNIKLFRRLEEMQNARYESLKRDSTACDNNNYTNNSSCFENASHTITNPHVKKFIRRSKSAAEQYTANYRSRAFARLSPQQQSRLYSKSAYHTASAKSPSGCSTSTFAHLDNFLTIPFLLLAFLSFLLVVESVSGCRLSEFTCGSYECIKADKYCDGETDCPDRSDEPRDCTRK